MTSEQSAGGSIGTAASSTQAPSAQPLAPTDPRLDAWRSFLHAHARVSRRLDEELQAGHHLSLAEYDALLQLVNAPGHRLRMSVLAERVLLSRSGITRLVDRLVAAGMVERTTCTTDARGAEAALTHAGHARLRDASITHLDGVRRLFVDVVPAGDRAAMDHGFGLVLDTLDCGAPAADACGPDAADS
jgi:DNA-binding MarR family transcriptional regulator